jgi:hypothetical protein
VQAARTAVRINVFLFIAFHLSPTPVEHTTHSSFAFAIAENTGAFRLPDLCVMRAQPKLVHIGSLNTPFCWPNPMLLKGGASFQPAQAPNKTSSRTPRPVRVVLGVPVAGTPGGIYCGV